MTGTQAQPVFLAAEWRDLAMLNYIVDPVLLRALVPAGTELDSFEGRTFVSLVGFRFLHTRVLGMVLPFHENFDEVNLRFYVRREGPNPRPDGRGWPSAGEARRGVVFVKEIVPRFAIAAVARWVFNENYVALPMSHSMGDTAVEYGWRYRRSLFSLRVEFEGQPVFPAAGSIEQFITEHYWGYAAQRDGGTVEYKVAHEPWRVWTATNAAFTGDASGLYGPALAAVLRSKPHSAFLAEGSPVTVHRGERILTSDS
jgi:uncharacterized protein YqjF (DUF2071 family)